MQAAGNIFNGFLRKLLSISCIFTFVPDYDSARRRFKGVQEKHEKLVMEAPTQTSGSAFDAYERKLQESNLELAKFQGKADIAKFLYTEENTKAITLLRRSRDHIFELINNYLMVISSAQVKKIYVYMLQVLHLFMFLFFIYRMFLSLLTDAYLIYVG